MSQWCAVKVRIDCPECGSAILVDGPYSSALCIACGARVTMSKTWGWIVSRALEDGAEGESFCRSTLVQAGRNGLGNIYVGLNKGHPPICANCDEVLDEVDQGVADGATGSFHCPRCGAAHPTWPAPSYLKNADVQQVFMAPPEEEQGVLPEPVGAKPILFQCPNCGGKLEMTAESKRVCTCGYCDVDMYLPSELWNQLHPVRRRRAFWMRCR